MTLSHAYKNISRYKKRYGYGKGFNAIIHYCTVALKNLRLDPKNNLVNVNGYELEVIPSDLGTSLELLLFGIHEPVSTKLVSKILKKDMTCLDIGSNIGYYVMLEKKILGDTGKIIALEPSPENFKYLTKNVQRTNSTNIELHNIAAGNVRGKLDFFMYDGESNSGHIVPDNSFKNASGKIIQVPVTPIDILVKDLNINKLDFLRMDVEGYEFEILKGMLNTLEKYRPIIQIEVHRSIMGNENTKKFFEILQKLDYEIKSYIPREIDTPMIGTLKDVKYYSMTEILTKLEKHQLPSFFMLSLESTNSN